jgi:ABC-type transporter Mla maintaining outer membrane lipid asymmetry permease subunit MlaE
VAWSYLLVVRVINGRFVTFWGFVFPLKAYATLGDFGIKRTAASASSMVAIRVIKKIIGVVLIG